METKDEVQQYLAEKSVSYRYSGKSKTFYIETVSGHDRVYLDNICNYVMHNSPFGCQVLFQKTLMSTANG